MIGFKIKSYVNKIRNIYKKVGAYTLRDAHMVLINPKRFNQELFDKSIQRKGFYEMICFKIKNMQINENIYKGVGLTP